MILLECSVHVRVCVVQWEVRRGEKFWAREVGKAQIPEHLG